MPKITSDEIATTFITQFFKLKNHEVTPEVTPRFILENEQVAFLMNSYSENPQDTYNFLAAVPWDIQKILEEKFTPDSIKVECLIAYCNVITAIITAFIDMRNNQTAIMNDKEVFKNLDFFVAPMDTFKPHG